MAQNRFCQIMIVNKVPYFPSIFPKSWLNISASEKKPYSFRACAAVLTKSFFDRNNLSNSRWYLVTENVLFGSILLTYCGVMMPCYELRKGLTSWLSFVVSSVSLSLSHWYPRSGVVLDCIDSWSLQPYLLSKFPS